MVEQVNAHRWLLWGMRGALNLHFSICTQRSKCNDFTTVASPPIQKSSHHFPDKSVYTSLLKCFWNSVPKLVRSPSRHSLSRAVIVWWGVVWKGGKKPNHKYYCLNCWKQSPALLAGIYRFYFLHSAPFLLSAQCQHEHFCCCTVKWRIDVTEK